MNIYLLKMHGIPLSQMIIYILTAYGWPALSKGMAIRQSCWILALKTARKGLCILCAAKKKPFLADPKFLKYKGFTVSDEADNGIQLWHLPFTENALLPKFKECAKHPHIDEMGYVLYYTSQCPFNAKYVPVIESIAKERSIKFRAIHLQNKEDAQNAPTPITTYALFLDGSYITNEQMNDKRFLKLLEKQFTRSG